MGFDNDFLTTREFLLLWGGEIILWTHSVMTAVLPPHIKLESILEIIKIKMFQLMRIYF